jgi:CDGSH-type Zn-finger protein
MSRERPASIQPIENGPLLVRGPITLLDEHGEEICARRRTLAICRCGRSRIQPFCDGTHKRGAFKPRTAADSPNQTA